MPDDISPRKFTVAPPHASLAVGAVNDGAAVHSIVVLLPALPIVGACVSFTVIVCDTVPLVLPHASTAFHVLVTVFKQELPELTSLPTCCTVAPVHASDAVGAVNDGVAVHSMVVLLPALPIVGGCVSATVIVCATVPLVLPHASTAFHVLVIVLTQALPAVISEPTWFTVAPLHASVAVGAVNDGVPVHSTVAGPPATPIVGACVSTNVMVCILVAL